MTTASTNTVIDQTSDATFRVWIAEVITAMFTLVGLTQTADTGQINTATVTRPGTANTVAGYVIGRFNDTLQSTVPIFFKLEFGTGGTATTSPNMWLTVGTGSNGSGTITGTTTTRNTIVGGVAASNVTTYISRWCYNTSDGIVAFAWKIGATAADLGGFALGRTCDNTSAPTNQGYLLFIQGAGVVTPGGSPGISVMYNFVSTLLTTGSPFINSNLNWNPFANTTTIVGGATVYVLPFFYYDAAGPSWMAFMGTGFASEFTSGTSVSLAMVGSTAHTFMPVPGLWVSTSIGNMGLALFLMPWE